ncbi:unnamed protein product [Prunus armeniaca]
MAAGSLQIITWGRKFITPTFVPNSSEQEKENEREEEGDVPSKKEKEKDLEEEEIHAEVIAESIALAQKQQEIPGA